MPCSAVTLSLATICGVVSAALLGIAFGTDNWQFFQVNGAISENFPQGITKPETNALFLTRTKGLFRTCFEGETPNQSKVPTYISPVETNCMNIDYYLAENSRSLNDMSHTEKTRLHMMRGMVGLIVLSFVFKLISLFTGLVGCWKRSPKNIGATAILILLACVCSGAAMGLWHYVEYYEREKLTDFPFRGGWNSQLEENTMVYYAWSYFMAWVSVGCSLVSALLFFGASVCLRNEREREESKSMALMMPVYGQKQQGYGGYNYGHGYPGPYHYASHPQQQGQYGHYNY